MQHSLLVFAAWISAWIVAEISAGELLAETALPVDSKPEDSGKISDQRFVLIEANRNKVANGSATPSFPPENHCVFDRNTKLFWEVKTMDEGLQGTNQTYSWYQPNMMTNGGNPGYRNQGICELVFCDTQTYIAKVNEMNLCGFSTWRLPTREELRSLVDYSIPYPGPAIDQKFFPNTKNQFYWSATPDANDKDSAWGIGFSFGYDYAYFKNDHGYIRLVSGPNSSGPKQ